ncbi:hypothetical protein GBA52_010358 [Prunus armeniaca]|nr:hypothetical protein GBA52_010358 [Prunus armeniaca]
MELYTLKNGLLFALDAGFVPLFVQTDCLNVVQLINNEEVCLAPEGSSVEGIRTLLQQVPIFPAKLILCSSYCTV